MLVIYCIKITKYRYIMHSDGTRKKELIKYGIPLHRNTKFRFHSVTPTNK